MRVLIKMVLFISRDLFRQATIYLMCLRLLPHRAGGKCAELWGCMLKNAEARDALGWCTAVQGPKEHNL